MRPISTSELDLCFRALRPKGSRGELSDFKVDPLTGACVAYCYYCKRFARLDRLDLEALRSPYMDNIVAMIGEELKKHWHVPPQPLTVKECEQVRVHGIHRRGALRCA